MEKKRSPGSLIIIALLVTAAAILLVRHFHIKNFNTVEPEVLYTSGQPRGMDYTRLLYRYHIASIINLRSQTEHRDKNWYNEEATWVRNNGVKYIELPIEKVNYFPNKETQGQFLAVMADKNNLPVLLHDGSGENRVAMLASVWLRKVRCCNVEDTVRFVEKIKGQPVTTAEREFIESLQ
jgi:protein tyrosine/serine phosphatase